jgi:hypothetical protein
VPSTRCAFEFGQGLQRGLELECPDLRVQLGNIDRIRRHRESGSDLVPLVERFAVVVGKQGSQSFEPRGQGLGIMIAVGTVVGVETRGMAKLSWSA